MADFKLDPLTGDLVVDGGVVLVEDYDQEARQRLEQALAINLGEWFLDITAGLPYIKNPKEDLPTNIRYFLGGKFPDTPRFIANTIDKYIQSLSFIRSVESTFTFNDSNREYAYNANIELIDGGVITVTPFTTTL